MTETVSALTNGSLNTPEASRQSVRASRNVPQASQGYPTELRYTPEASFRSPTGLRRTSEGSSRSPTELRCMPEGSFRSPTGLRCTPEGSFRSGRALLRSFIHFTYLGKALGQPKKTTPQSPSASPNLPDTYLFGDFSLSLPRRRGEGRGEGLRVMAQAAAPLIRPAATFSPPPRRGEGASRSTHFL